MCIFIIIKYLKITNKYKKNILLLIILFTLEPIIFFIILILVYMIYLINTKYM